MVETTNTVNAVTTTIAQGLGTAGTVVLWVLGILVVALIGGYIWYKLSFIHTLIIRSVSGNRVLTRFVKAREYVDERKVTWWRADYKNKKYAHPPTDAIDIDHRGKKFAEVFDYGNDNYIWLALKNPEQGNKDIYTTYDLLDTSDKEIIANQVVKAEAKRRKSGMEMLKEMLPFIMMGMIVIIMIVFWGDMAEPLISIQEKQLESARLHLETSQNYKDAMAYLTNNQIIGGNVPTPAPN